MVGMIVLVLAGVGLSLVIDRRLSFSSGRLGIQREINLDASELEGLIAVREERSRLLNDKVEKPQIRAETSAEILGKLESLRRRQASLEITRQQLREMIARQEDDFSRFRAEYRRRTWADAPGEKLGILVVSNGREYREATITRVTEVGLEIRHADGIARVQAPDLDQEIQDRFQWSDEDRRKILKDEQDHLESISGELAEAVPAMSARIQGPLVREPLRPQAKAAPNIEELAALRRMVVVWKSKVTKLRFEKSEAMSNSSYGNQTSVPGSLETWGAKAERIGNELARAQSALAVAKSNLAAAAPGDPLLRPDIIDP